MWQRVLANNDQLVDKTYRVLSEHATKWSSAADFKHWLEESGDYVFYESDEKSALVLGFRAEADGRWSGSLVGASGEASSEALQRLLDKTISFMKEYDARSVHVRVTRFPSPNPYSAILQMALDAAQAHPDVAGVFEKDVGNQREYTLTLLGSPA
jgi:hypothetical protein